MLSKPSKSRLHKKLQILDKRMELTKEQVTLLNRLQSGYEGELQFYNLIKKFIPDDALVIFDILLNFNDTEFQIDCLIIFQYEIYLFEVKNYEGDFLFADNNWYLSSKEKVNNPLHQLNRTELLFSQFLKQNKASLKVNSHLVFINPMYMLYQAPVNLPIVFPAQLQRFLTKLRHVPSELNSYHDKILDLITTRHKTTSSYESPVDYNLGMLKKGIFCRYCNGSMEIFNSVKVQCNHCGDFDLIEKVIVRSAKEFEFLFPEKKITISRMHKWLNFKISKYIIRKVLQKNATVFGTNRNTFYKLNS